MGMVGRGRYINLHLPYTMLMANIHEKLQANTKWDQLNQRNSCKSLANGLDIECWDYVLFYTSYLHLECGALFRHSVVLHLYCLFEEFT